MPKRSVFAMDPSELDLPHSFVMWQFSRDHRFLPRLLDHIEELDPEWRRQICAEAALILSNKRKVHLRSANKKLRAIAVAVSVDLIRPPGMSIARYLQDISLNGEKGKPLSLKQLENLLKDGRMLIEAQRQLPPK